jgi:Flp pilus assembly protein TadG
MAARQTFLRRLIAPAVSRGHAFARDERGVTALEFGILALPFFTLIAAILETTMVFLAGQVLDSAVEDASRLIKTGQAQSATTNSAFRTFLCGYTFNLFDCANIRIQVKDISNFGSTALNTSPTTCTATTCTLTMTEDWVPGGRRAVVQVRAYYRWPLLVNLPYFNMRNQPDSFRLIGATRVFRNEPF